MLPDCVFIVLGTCQRGGGLEEAVMRQTRRLSNTGAGRVPLKGHQLKHSAALNVDNEQLISSFSLTLARCVSAGTLAIWTRNAFHSAHFIGPLFVYLLLKSSVGDRNPFKMAVFSPAGTLKTWV